MDWEDWLRTAAKPPSDHEDAKRVATEAQVKEALSSSSALKGRPYRVYAKGSYANNTNVRLNYDVDIAVEYYGYFYSDLTFDLAGQDRSSVGVVDSTDPYDTADFKQDIKTALVEAYGDSAVSVCRIAYRVREEKTTLPADVVPCWEYRRYDRIEGGRPIYHQGTRVFPSDGGHVDNFPAVQLENGVAKNIATGRRYKRMVRCLKKLQTRLADGGLIDEELASYLTECLVYNVPNEGFQNYSYLADMRAVLASIFNSTLPSGDCDDWHEVHELTYLFRGNQSWTRSQVHRVVSQAWDHMCFELFPGRASLCCGLVVHA